MIISVPFLTPAMRGRLALPFVPANPVQVGMVLRVMEERLALGTGKRPQLPPGTVGFVDLGSGDGRVVLEVAKRGVTAHGIELNLPLVLYSRLAAIVSGAKPRPKYYRQYAIWGG